MRNNTSSLYNQSSCSIGSLGQQTSGIQKKVDRDYEYVFFKHNAHDKSPKEQRIASFLDDEGIFMINIKACLEDYTFSF